jgi:hypothetical protein
MTWFNSAVRGNSLFVTTSDRRLCLAARGQSSKWLPPFIISLGVGMPWLQSLTIGTYPSCPFIICSMSDGSASSSCSLVLSISSIQKLCNLARQLTNAIVLTMVMLHGIALLKIPCLETSIPKAHSTRIQIWEWKKCNHPWNQMKHLGMELPCNAC